MKYHYYFNMDEIVLFYIGSGFYFDFCFQHGLIEVHYFKIQGTKRDRYC